MKKTKSILAFFLVAVLLCSSFSFGVSALPKITDIRWNDDFSAEYHFDGAATYSYSIYLNDNMVWGFGTSSQETITREKMLPYMVALAQDAMARYSYFGTVSFDLVMFAKDGDGKSISDKTVVSKSLKIEDVAAGKLSPDTEKWQYRVNTSDKVKLSEAMHKAYDQDKSKIVEALQGTGLTYEQYITAVITTAGKESYFTFKGTLAQTLRFGSVYNSYCYTDVRLADSVKEISEVNITIKTPKHGQKAAAYFADSSNIQCTTEGVTVMPTLDAVGVREVTTNTNQKKFYSGNQYAMGFFISYKEGYAPAATVVVKVNGQEATFVSPSKAEYNGYWGYHCSEHMTVPAVFPQTISTFFHNLFMKMLHPKGMPV